MSNIAIKVENLSKRYRIGLKEDSPDTLLGTVTSWLKAPFTNFRQLRKLSHFSDNGNNRTVVPVADSDDIIWAVKDVSFEVKQGEVLGIIGRNGAGKSTLLKILARITEPTSGRVVINGRVASLLEVGTGFHPELTGRENVYLNGTILGMTKKEVNNKFDEIVDFAGVEKFIDTPVKRYSSGMQVRLAFAVAAHLEPEIMLVDEVLAVGDAEFQKKCLGKMSMIAKEGRTVLFVSHNMGTIQQLCIRAILLNEGSIALDNSPGIVIGQYLTAGLKQKGERVWPDIDQAPGNEIARLHAVRVLDRHDKVCTYFDVRDPVFLEMEYWILKDIDYLDSSFCLYNERGEMILGTSDDSYDIPSGDRKRSRGFYKAVCHIPPDFLNNGQIYIQAALTEERLVHTIQRDVVTFSVGDAMDPRGARGNYHAGEWPPCAVRPKLKWSAEIRLLEQEITTTSCGGSTNE